MNIQRTLETDVLVIGGGGAGARAACAASDLGVQVTIVVKGKLGASGCTTRAVSELSAYSAAFGHTDPRDNAYCHFRDTTVQGGGLSNERLVRRFVLDAPARLREIVALGGKFVMKGDRFEQLLADASTLPRACHAGAETGREIASVLRKDIQKRDNVQVLEQMMITRLLSYGGAVVGAVALNLERGDLVVIKCKSVILATGGAGNIYSLNAQPPDVTGDGFSLAYRAGAVLTNMEFIQIGPAMVHPVRGYLLVTRFWKLGPRIYNRNQEEFLPKYLPEGVTADTVIRAKEYAFPFIINYPAMHLDIAMHTEIKEGRGTEHGGIYMDVSHNSAEHIENTVPVTFKWLLDRGIDIRKQPIEIAPVVQCFIGGVRYNEDGATDVPGLFVCGEVSGGAHGAARPGGNLLAISQVFGRIAGVSAAKRAKPICRVNLDEAEVAAEVDRLNGLLAPGGEPAKSFAAPLKKLLWDNVSCVRNHDGLTAVLRALCVAQTQSLPKVRASNVQELREALEFEYLLDTAEMVTRAALARNESRGTHYREDAPKLNNYRWLKNINIRMVNGAMKLSLARPVTIPDFEACEEEEL